MHLLQNRTNVVHFGAVYDVTNVKNIFRDGCMLHTKLTTVYIACALIFLASEVMANELTVLWELDNFDKPESMLYDKQHNVVFVSNVDGVPNEKDGKGYISVLSLQGEIKNKYWVTGLNAPKGLGRYDNLLYVTDIDTLLEINIDNGKIQNRYYSPEAKFLNDVIVNDNGHVYVSDMVTNSIYCLVDNEFSVWLQSDELENPNGLYIENGHLIVGAWGKMTDGFSTDIPGHLKSVSLKDKQIKSLGHGKPVGNLDGVEVDGKGNFYVTDWMSGGLFLISRTGDAEKVLQLPKGSADHDVVLSEGIILVPRMLEDKLTAYKIH